MQPVIFKITDDNLRNFSRRVVKPKDCVINALQVVGFVDEKPAELMRILVGDKGVEIDQIESIFNFFNPKFRFTFKKYDSADPIDVSNVQAEINKLPNGCVLFCGLTWKNTRDSHVFILGRFTNGEYVVIDPQKQQAYQDLNNYLTNAQELFILRKTPRR